MSEAGDGIHDHRRHPTVELDRVGRLGDGAGAVSSVPVTIRDAETAPLATSNDSAAVAERRLESASSDSTAPARDVVDEQQRHPIAGGERGGVHARLHDRQPVVAPDGPGDRARMVLGVGRELRQLI